MPEIYKPKIIDTTLREGGQSPQLAEGRKYFFRTEDKVVIFTGLAKFGVRYIEVFSPVVSPQERADLEALIETRNRLVREGHPYVNILAHTRCAKEDIEEALRAGVDGLNLYFGTSPESISGNHGKSLEQISRIAVDLISNVRRDLPNLSLRFSGEDAFRTKFSDLVIPYKAVAEFVDRFGTPDTVGMARSGQVRARIQQLRREFPSHDLEVHMHQDSGRALDNAEVAFLAGAQFINTTLNGLGERNGITDMGDFIYRMYERDPNLVEDYAIELTYPLNVLAADLVGEQVPRTSVVNSFRKTHAAGPHVAAMLKNPKVYEGGIDMKTFGIDQRVVLLGTLSGWNAVHYFLINYLNFEGVTEEIAKEIYPEYKESVNREIKNNPELKPTDVLDQIALKRGLRKVVKLKTQHEGILNEL